MAKPRTNLATLNLRDAGKPAEPKEHAPGKRANTVRLPTADWEILRHAAAILDTDQGNILHAALHEWLERNREDLRAKQLKL